MTGWDEFLFELRRSCFGHFHDADCDVIHRAAFKREIDQRARDLIGIFAAQLCFYLGIFDVFIKTVRTEQEAIAIFQFEHIHLE